ncbi:alpha/beta hydrolase [Nocardioides sp.]|uniref:alpha/beta fold hydrolase n=1 Tax=Nocardioides sp. TaxID=35761 RepID=UPI002C41BF60|nr:alpha/beta hydrolase [Nocardioides sp.]HXH80632.1 alpha/beta hydrolase [Nocardioides sp.]
MAFDSDNARTAIRMPRGQVLGSRLDSWLTARTARRRGGGASSADFDLVETSGGTVRLFDSRTVGPVVVLVPDGPNVIEHYDGLVPKLGESCRVVCFDMPGFGFSRPSKHYTHSLDDGAAVVLDVLDHLQIPRATLAFSCANGFYALRAATLAPDRIAGLVLSQTPSIDSMHAWTDRTIPKPLRVPVLGHGLGWFLREKAALGWYAAALPRTTDAAPFRHVAKTALQQGACFCLAGVVQGLTREPSGALGAVDQPCTLVWGGSDRSHRHTDPTSLRETLPRAELIAFDHCGHFPDLEDAEQFAELVKERVAAHQAS